MIVYCLFSKERTNDGHTCVELEAIYTTKESAESWKKTYERINDFYKFEYFIEERELEE